MLERILKSWNYEVLTVTDGKQAMDILTAEHAPKLVLLDWMMPEMLGIDVCKNLRAVETDNPAYIILLTAKSKKDDILKGFESGADDFVSKPFNKDELRARLSVGKRMLKLRENLREKIAELEQAVEHIQTLQGILPICMYCHKIRTDSEAWERIDMYVERHSDAQFSHSLCPDCLEKYYPEDDENEESA
jgi:PleD family two-component response regulator